MQIRPGLIRGQRPRLDQHSFEEAHEVVGVLHKAPEDIARLTGGVLGMVDEEPIEE